ncbi:hypothetical protein [Virgibacillus sp. SK37]|uniref:hypothetical protein n=1 Tax=Virgibacillus sp. SK37 TaxID=403957 RepID=UPI0004D1972E|nr:hypothetical protein [Virgibacillus sp. SK37]AIF45637.1 hypothetical protein X953_18775 [Virgibacillus sp. SK37]
MNFIERFFTGLVSLIAGFFGIAVNQGIVDKLGAMFLLMALFSFSVLLVEYTINVMDKKHTLLDYTLPLAKMFFSLGIFIILSVSSIIGIGVDGVMHDVLYFTTWSYTGLMVTSNIIQLLRFGNRIGLPGMNKLIEVVEGISSIFTKKK